MTKLVMSETVFEKVQGILSFGREYCNQFVQEEHQDDSVVCPKDFMTAYNGLCYAKSKGAPYWFWIVENVHEAEKVANCFMLRHLKTLAKPAKVSAQVDPKSGLCVVMAEF